jgi:glycosyltransferase involved in cell wall biosynthesis
MRLDVDLSFDAVPKRELGPGATGTLDLHAIAASLRAPSALWKQLRAGRYDEVRILEGTLPLSAVQAAALLSLVAVRAHRFVVGDRTLTRKAFTRYALARAVRAAPEELARSCMLATRVDRHARRRYRLASSTPSPGKALYVRVDPTLNWFGIQVGGSVTHTTGVINGLLDNGIDVDVLAAERPVGTERAQFIQVPPRRVLQLVRGLTYTDYTEPLLDAAAGRSGDFVYQRYQLGAYAGLELARRLGVPLVLEFNGPEAWVERHWGTGRMRLARQFDALESRNVCDASLVVVVSKPLRDYVVSRGVDPDRVLVNPNGVDVDSLAPYRVGSPADWRRRLGIQEAPTVGFIGTFGPWHGVKLLPSLIEAVPDARWILIGDGSLMPEVRNEIQERDLSGRTLLPGVIEHDRAIEMLACCDVCVSPHVPNPDGTPFFGSPTKLFEYMGLRRATVAADLDQIGEVIEHGHSGLLFTPGDVDEGAAAVTRLLGDNALRERLAAGALERVATHYTWTAHVRRILVALGSRAAAEDHHPAVSLTP